MKHRILILIATTMLAITGCTQPDDTTAEEATTTTTATVWVETTEAATTTTTPPTTTTAGVTPTLPPDLVAKHPVVVTEGIRGPDTQAIAVWSPDADGSWPVLVLLHGYGSKGIHYNETASHIAGQGVVVFAPDYRSTEIDTADWRNVYRDVECAYRHVRSIATEYGGDLSLPITVAGHSLGALVGMGVTLNESAFAREGDFDRCPGDIPRPDQVVGLSGCYAKNAITGTTLPFDPTGHGWANHDVPIDIVVGTEDEVCEVWQSEDARQGFLDSGYSNVELTTIEHGDHFSVIFTGYENGPWYGPDVEWYALPKDPTGMEAVQAILAAIAATN